MHPVIASTLNREFDVTKPNQTSEVLCGDITYVWTSIRWAMTLSQGSDLTSKVLTVGLESRDCDMTRYFTQIKAASTPVYASGSISDAS